MFASLPLVTTSSQRLIPRGRQNLKSRMWERSERKPLTASLPVQQYCANREKSVVSRTLWKCAWKPISHLRGWSPSSQVLSCLAMWKEWRLHTQVRPTEERLSAWWIREWESSSLTHKIVDKEVTPFVIKINNVGIESYVLIVWFIFIFITFNHVMPE